MTAYFKGQPIFGPRGPAGPDGNPIGAVISYMGQSAPKDYLACDGAVYNISEYSELAAFFQNQFGAANHFGGDGTATFAVPDLAKEDAGALPCIKAAEGFQEQDVYSTEEARIGTWIDGKPLYQQTVVLTQNYGSLTQLSVPSNIETPVSICGFAKLSSQPRWGALNFDVDFRAFVSSNGLVVQKMAPYDAAVPANITIKYTKTTD